MNTIKNRRIFTSAGIDPTLYSRITVLENNEYKVTYFTEISSDTGTITKPTGSTILENQFPGGVDAYVSTISSGQPTGENPVTAAGALVDVTSFNTSGGYTLSGVPSAYPVALIYVIKIPAISWSNLTLANIIEDEDLNPEFLDNQFILKDNADQTKKAAFQLSGISTATTRILTIPDSDGTIALTAGTEVPLTFSTGLSRITNTITSNLSTGIAGGQSVIGGTATGENLTLTTTTHATKGSIIFGNSRYNESTNSLLIGSTTPYGGLNGETFEISRAGAGGSTYAGMNINSFNSTASRGPIIIFQRSKSAVLGTQTIVANGDLVGSISFTGSDGTAFRNSAQIRAEIDGTPGANDMPGRIVFSTTPDGSTTLTEGWRISNNQTLSNTGSIGTAYLHLKAGTATANTAPIKFTKGVLNTSAVAGQIEYDGMFYSTTNSGLRYADNGVIANFYTDVNNSGTSETDLYSYTLIASGLGVNGDMITAKYGGTFNDVTATAQLKVLFGGTTIFDSGAITISATGAWTIDVAIIRTGTTTARALVNLNTSTASATVYTTQTDLTGLTLSNTNILKITGTSGGAGGGSNDITAKLGYINFHGVAAN